jgi:hypothetical protein
MAKLTDLINFHDSLVDIVNKLSIDQIIDEKISIINSINTTEFVHSLAIATDNYQKIKVDSQNIINDLNNLISTVEQKIDTVGDEIIEFQKQNQLIDNQFYPDSQKTILDSIRSAVASNGRWQYPGLILYPPSKTWIDLMVASDPLYLIVDVSSQVGVKFDKNDTQKAVVVWSEKFRNQLLENLIKEYPEQYQRRLRLYENIDLLPQNQFGLILTWDFITYLPISETKKYFHKFLNLLRPGGTLIFNYNNCDIDAVAELAEGNYKYYFSEGQLKKILIEIGFDVIKSEDEYSDNLKLPDSWMKIQKPGELTTVKRAQALGSVLSK